MVSSSPSTERASLELLAHNSADFIGIADLAGMPVFTNDAAMRMVGAADADEMRRTPVIDYFVPEDRPFVECVVLPTVLREGRWVGELRLRHFRTGKPIPIIYDVFLIRDPTTGEPRQYATISRDISEQKALEQALRENAERLRVALDAAGAGTFRWDLRSNALTWDDSLDRLFGLEPGKTARSLEQFVELVHPEDRAGVIARCEASRRDGADFEMEFRVRWPDGTDHWLYDRGKTFRVDGEPAYMTGACVDITRRKAIEAVAKRSTERLQLALEATAVGTWDYDPKTGGLIWDDQCRALFGVAADENIDYASFLELLYEPDRAPTHAQVERALAPGNDGSFSAEYRTSRLVGGAQRWIHATGRTVFQDGAAVRFIGTAQDVTERKHAERALREADRRKSEFLATLAHELRNPLAPIRNGLQALRFSERDSSVLPKVRPMMERQLAQMVRLIDDLMDLSRIDHGRIELDRRKLDLCRVVRAAVDASQPLIRSRNHRFALDLPAEPVFVDADETRMIQVISNLLNNAAKYTPPGGSISVGVRNGRGLAVVSVRDTGIGIPLEMQQQVFESFTRLENDLADKPSGLGIGLSICARLVQMHGGTLEVHSAGPGQGSEFVVTLAAVERDSAPAPRNDSMPVRTPRRVIVADDNADAAAALKLVLEVMGHEVRAMQRGRDVAGVVREFEPDIVLLDIGMPDMNGYEVCRAVRGHDVPKRPLIAAVTGWGQAGDKEKARDAGFDDHLVKPVDLASLDALFARLDGR